MAAFKRISPWHARCTTTWSGRMARRMADRGRCWLLCGLSWHGGDERARMPRFLHFRRRRRHPRECPCPSGASGSSSWTTIATCSTSVAALSTGRTFRQEHHLMSSSSGQGGLSSLRQRSRVSQSPPTARPQKALGVLSERQTAAPATPENRRGNRPFVSVDLSAVASSRCSMRRPASLRAISRCA